MANWKYNEESSGLRLNVPSDSVFSYDGEYLHNVSVSVDQNEAYTQIILTGWYLAITAGNYYQTTGGEYYKYDAEQAEKGYLGRTTVNASVGTAQTYINGVIAANKTILENNLLCARFAAKLTSDERYTLYQLQRRLTRRDTALRRDGFCQQQTQSYPRGYSNLNGYLVDFMDDPKLAGIGSTTLFIVVSAVVVASLGAAAYFAYRAYYEQAIKDVKYSDELTATLRAKLTDDEYRQLEQETAGMITKATIAAKTQSAFGWAKYVALGGMAALAAWLIFKPKNKKND